MQGIAFQAYKDPATQKLIKPWLSLTRIHTEQGLLLNESKFYFNLWIGSFCDSICGFQHMQGMLAEYAA